MVGVGGERSVPPFPFLMSMGRQGVSIAACPSDSRYIRVVLLLQEGDGRGSASESVAST